MLRSSPDGSYNPFPNYSYTGSIRPMYPLSSKRVVPEHIPRPEYVPDGTTALFSLQRLANRLVPGNSISEIRAAGTAARLLSKEEQEKMRTVCRVSQLTLPSFHTLIHRSFLVKFLTSPALQSVPV